MKVLKLFILAHIPLIGALLTRAFAHGSPQEVADKWAQNIGNSRQSMTAGVGRVTQAPSQSAINQRQKFQTKMQDPSTFDKWEAGLRGVSLQSWQNSMTSFGIDRAVQGATQKKDKMVRAMNGLLPFVDQLRNTVRNMPSTTVGDREQRMLAWSRGMAQYRKPASGS